MKLKSALPWAVTVLLLCVFLMLPLLFLDGGEIAIIGSVPAEDRNVTSSRDTTRASSSARSSANPK